jgi:3-deoxy-D-manno-octulosonate 8-phosphate phosphatase (KDO 8-P phosphatase)
MRIECLVLDVDGVLTDGRLWYGGPEPLRAFHIRDGLAIRAFQVVGGTVAILTGKTSKGVADRAAELGIRHVIQGSTDKWTDLLRLLDPLGIDARGVAMIGDDLPDLPVLRGCGYPIAVCDAAPEVRAAARYVTAACGGRGAVREAVEHLCRADGRWARVVATYDRVPAREAEAGVCP